LDHGENQSSQFFEILMVLVN